MKTNHSKEELKLYGIYKILNTITNDFYIGSTIESFNKRKSKHIYDFKNNKKNCKKLYNSILKYNIENFEFIILKAFKNKKESNRTKQIITYIEEKYINNLNPKYNICKHPTRGGCPNLGKKLSKEWKNKIGEKSKLYKHTGDNYIKINKQNKEGSSLYKINNDFIGSLIDCSKHYNVDVCTILNVYNKKYNSKKILNVEKIKSQKKKIMLFLENENNIIFNSYSECDKFLQMWRGYTSTQVVNNKSQILTYNYKLIDEDIV
jgi:group I intron endonuclease